jgi:hypothetical protein
VKLNWIIGCVLVTACSSSSHLGRNEVRSASPLADRIHQALDQTVIPEVDLENVSAANALKVWTEKSCAAHPQHFKFPHVLSYPAAFTQGTTQSAGAPPRIHRVTVRRRAITSKRLLDEICEQAGLTWTIMGKVIVVRPRSSTAQ